MSITMHTGRPGTGKTYCLTRQALIAIKKGHKVYANYKIFSDAPNLFFWKDPAELRTLRQGVIIMDEAHVYFNSRKWKDLPEEMLKLLAQHRKCGLHIEGTVQNVNRLDVVMRELIDFWYVYQDYPFWFIRTEFDLDEDKTKRYPLTKRIIPKRKKIYAMYDTLETINF